MDQFYMQNQENLSSLEIEPDVEREKFFAAKLEGTVWHRYILHALYVLFLFPSSGQAKP